MEVGTHMKINIILIILLISSLAVSNKSFAEDNPNIQSEAAHSNRFENGRSFI